MNALPGAFGDKMSNMSVGSTWKKWDLHVHTPASIVHNYEGNNEEAWQAFLADLERLPPEFKVIGINDYLFVDGYERVLREKASGRLANIDLILPVVELRLDKFAGVVKRDKDGSYSKSDWNRINLHVIFDALDPDTIRQQFLSALAPSYDLIPSAAEYKGRWNAVITPQSVTQLGELIISSVPEDKRSAYGSPAQEGFNNLCVSMDKVIQALDNHILKDRFLIAVGKTEWDNMKWDDQSIAEKKNVINRANIVFTAAESPEKYEQARSKLIDSNVNNLLLDCSDAHATSDNDHKDRVGNCFTWIKADATFEGLRHALTEFKDRVFVGDRPPKLRLADQHRTKYVSRIKIGKKVGVGDGAPWFDADIPLNHDLVAIIGNKGSGKSAMVDILSLAGGTKNGEGFSFLTPDRFRSPKTKFASRFVAALTWHDGSATEQALDLDPSASAVERVKYLPQKYVDTLCNELGELGSGTFDAELRKIIYTHVPEEDRLGHASMDKYLDFKVAEIAQERARLARELTKVNAEIIAIEGRMSEEFRQTLVARIEAKNGELTAHDASKPVQVEDPSASEASQAESNAASARIQELETLAGQLRAEETAARDRKVIVAKKQATLMRAEQALENHRKSHAQFVSELDVLLHEAGADFTAADLVQMSITTAPIRHLLTSAKMEAESLDATLGGDLEGSIPKRREALERDIAAVKSKLGERARLFVLYKEELGSWERRRADLVGAADKPNTLAGLQAELDGLAGLPAQLQASALIRSEMTRSIHALIAQTVEEYRRLYAPVQAFVKSIESMDMPLPLGFDVRIEESSFQDGFLDNVNRQSRGTFAGVEESSTLVRNLLREAEFSSAAGSVEFAEKIDRMLRADHRDSGDMRATKFSDQLKKGRQPGDVLDYLYGLAYLAPRYSLTFNGQEISQLSPGERGLLLLVFYLLVDKDDIPLVIDQPEENLDNQTIYRVLVTCIKAAKQRRQVIMVTHNPNLAVVCDAEQIIYATHDKATNRFAYISGAVESPKIKECVVEILEGTEPAFRNRKQKYGL